ncbi:single strand annealing protein [Rhodococcus phage ReqiPoco6]|uniref:Gp078 n=1 Tax=Rhodococcus phage ReqiPoco6 TaxID=691964 RepID=D4P7U6_9CAUD|nr:single strand annealing protein [Rhodococcus phage ReqiPoco6]ADD81076.1 gp078 [Rhodococcus phage ReqiPoco6]
MAIENGQLLVENAQIIFRNFAGKEGMYNAEGDRNFCLLLEPELAEALMRDGWNVKHLKAREEGDEPQAYIQVSIKYRGRNGNAVRPPSIVMITSKGRSNLDEDMCEMIDWVDIANVDLIVRPFEWSVNGKSGIKAYLKAIYVTIQEDALALKYQDLPEIGANGALAIESGEQNDYIEGEVVDIHDDDTLAIEG